MATIALRKRLALLFTVSSFTIALIYYWRLQYSPQISEERLRPKPVIPEKPGLIKEPPGHDDAKLQHSTASIDTSTSINTITQTSDIPSPSSGIPSSPSVTISQGTYIGKQTSKYPQVLEEFLGIPYALPPIEDLRFRPPVPVNTSTAIFDATNPALRCMSGPDNQPQSEDCLHLNIYRSKSTTNLSNEKLPVLVHVHGGAFNFGYANDRGIASLVGWSKQPLIAVTFEYRLGALGFLPSKLMAEEKALNLGLKDQKLLLEWVQKHISSFGGDPENITLMGPSAGAHSIGHHLMKNNGSPPLFAKAIIESGGPTARAVYHYDNPLHEVQFSELLEKLELSSTPRAEILSRLRSLPVSSIKAASEQIFESYNPSLRWPFQPCIDGPSEDSIIPMPPIEALLNNTYHHIPILTGYNTNEGSIFVPKTLDKVGSFLDFFHVLLPNLPMEDLSVIDSLYPNPEYNLDSPYSFNNDALGVGNQFRRLDKAYGDYAYISPVRQTAYFASGEHPYEQPLSNSSLPKPAPVYLYEYAVNSSVLNGAAHGSQYPFPAYATQVVDKSATTKEIAGLMHAYWTSFIISPTGNPNAIPGRYPTRTVWPEYKGGEGKRQKIIFGRGNDEIAGGKEKGVVVEIEEDRKDSIDKEACDFWWNRVGLWES
ncbi:putative extracellular lipase protein [Botrytis cinerea BcDW1]|uniref:Carboxylic ester hydrolase n=1 Tax=Botryotinia fuckeliana (strain BcDW1) TaxID=1290391 RepID=M7U6C9_BOTF1|nr:putative extracellular lipase protein [Botrytis cinerea BcDW1]